MYATQKSYLLKPMYSMIGCGALANPVC